MFVEPSAMRAQRSDSRAEALECLNAVTVSASMLEGAMRAIATLPPDQRGLAAAQALVVQAYVEAQGIEGGVFASAALHARFAALDGWTRAHDPNHASNAEAVIEAAARQPLARGENGLMFEPVSFGELVLFVEDLPY